MTTPAPSAVYEVPESGWLELTMRDADGKPHTKMLDIFETYNRMCLADNDAAAKGGGVIERTAAQRDALSAAIGNVMAVSHQQTVQVFDRLLAVVEAAKKNAGSSPPAGTAGITGSPSGTPVPPQD